MNGRTSSCPCITVGQPESSYTISGSISSSTRSGSRTFHAPVKRAAKSRTNSPVGGLMAPPTRSRSVGVNRLRFAVPAALRVPGEHALDVGVVELLAPDYPAVLDDAD